MSKRKALTKKTRFEVFKRDGFTCQYCGKAAPDVILHVDHIDPVSKGGDNTILNLITSCAECNCGKGATKLDDQATLAKQRQQLVELSDRREQLKMMLDWRKGMKSIDDLQVEAAQDHFSTTFDGWRITSDGAVAKLRQLLREFGLQAVMDAMDIARDRYAATLSNEAVNVAWSKVGGICRNRSKPRDSSAYIRGILRNRFSYVHELVAIELIRSAVAAGLDDDYLQEIAKHSRNWSEWQARMADAIDEAAQ